MQNPYFRGICSRRTTYWFLLWLLLAAPLATAQISLVENIFPAFGQTATLNGKLYFAAASAATGTELYRSDLSGLNLELVKDIVPGAAPSEPADLTNVNGTLFFGTNAGLYKSDGTAAGTVLLKSFPDKPGTLTNVNGTLFFSAGDGSKGRELWKSNGTAAGTVLVKDINPNAPASDPAHLVNLNGTLLFAATSSATGRELWKSDGTAAGTVLVKDIFPGTATDPYDPAYPGPNSSEPAGLTSYNGAAYFSARDGVYGRELWRSDGTAAGTVLVDDILFDPISEGYPPISSGPRQFTVVNNNLYFVADIAPFGLEKIFRTDGTATGTVIVGGATQAKFNSSAEVTGLASVNGTLYYGTFSYGTAVGYIIDLRKIDASGGDAFVRSFALGESSLSEFTNLNGTLYFIGNDGLSGQEIWKVDPAGAVSKLPELNPGPGSSNPFNLFGIGNVLYFTSNYGTGTSALWKYDGNSPTTSDIRLNAGGPAHQVMGYDEFGNPAPGQYFSADAYFSGGNTSAYPASDGGYIGNVYDPTLYRTARWGQFSYNVPVTKGEYRIILHFAEMYWGNGRAGGAGSRRFNVDVEGVRKLTNYDIIAKAGGTTTAIRETLTAEVTDGTLNIAFVKGAADNPIVSAIEIIPVAVANQAPVLTDIGPKTIESGKTLTFTASATDADGDALTYSLVQLPYGSPFPVGATINPTTGAFTWTPTQPGTYQVLVRVTDNGSPTFFDEEQVEICVTPKTTLTVIGSTVCNVANGSTGVTGTITIKNSEREVSYGLSGTEPEQANQLILDGNGGDLVFAVKFDGAVRSPFVYTFNITAFSCRTVNLPPVQVVLVPPLSAPDAAGKTVSSGQTATLAASGAPAGAVYRWYSAPSGGTPLFTGATFTTPALTVTTSYYVSIASNGCESPRKQVTVTVTGGAATAFRVNAGGNTFSTIDSRSFSGDAYFSGGVVSAATPLGIAGTADDYLYQTGRHGSSFAYNLPTGNGAYDVVLHFAETWWGNAVPGGVGSRRFHVDIEGARRLTDYDIFAKAGGALRVAQETFRVNVSDGTLNVNFLKGLADNPAIKAIEVLPAGAALAINSGGSAFTTTAGKVFSPDVYFAQGNVSSIPSGEIANTSDDALYRNARFGPAFSYGLPSGNGTYDVVLHFAETWWGARTTGGAGSRRFDVYVEGVKRLSDYDIFAKAGGAMRAVRETLRVTVSDGVLNLYFAKGSADNAIVSAIEVVPVTGPARSAAQEQSAESWQVRLYPNPVQDQLTVQLPFPAGQVKATAVTDAAGAVRLSNAHKAVGADQLQLQVGALKKGFYLLRLDTEHGQKVVKFLKQ